MIDVLAMCREDLTEFKEAKMKKVEYIGRITEQEFANYSIFMIDGHHLNLLIGEFLEKRVRLVITELPEAECQYASVDGIVVKELYLVKV